MDALQWGAFRQHWLKELIFVVIPFGIAMLSPRRLLVLLIGLGLPLFRYAFLVFVFRNTSSALAVVAWAVLLVIVGACVNTTYDDIPVPEGTTGVELLLLMTAIAMSVLAAWKLHAILN